MPQHQELTMPSARERGQMDAAGFTWDPTEPWAGAYPRWTHFDKNITALRQPYMTDQQWESQKATKIEEASNFKVSE